MSGRRSTRMAATSWSSAGVIRAGRIHGSEGSPGKAASDTTTSAADVLSDQGLPESSPAGLAAKTLGTGVVASLGNRCCHGFGGDLFPLYERLSMVREPGCLLLVPEGHSKIRPEDRPSRDRSIKPRRA